MMNKWITVIVSSLVSITCLGQQFTCETLEETIAKWNETFAGLSSDSKIECAQAVVDNKVYSINESGQMEYVFIIHSSDTLDISRMKEVTVDYLQAYSNMSQRDRESVVQSTMDRSVFYQTYYQHLATQTGVFQKGVFSVYSQVIFEFKFKEDRIRVRVNVPVVYYETKLFHGTYLVRLLYPLYKDKGLTKLQRESQAQALINVHGRSLGFVSGYLNWIGARYPQSISPDDDW